MAAETAEGSWPAAKAAVAELLQSRLGQADVELDQLQAERMLLAIAWALVEGSR